MLFICLLYLSLGSTVIISILGLIHGTCGVVYSACCVLYSIGSGVKRVHVFL